MSDCFNIPVGKTGIRYHMSRVVNFVSSKIVLQILYTIAEFVISDQEADVFLWLPEEDLFRRPNFPGDDETIAWKRPRV